MSYSECYGRFYKPGTLRPRKKVVFSEDALTAAEEAFSDAVRQWDSIDWSKKTAREAGVERTKLFRTYMTLQKLAMSPGGPSPAGTTPGGYLHGFWSQYTMRVRDPRFMATGVTVDMKGSPAAKQQAALAKIRKHELGRNPKIATGSGAWTVYYEVHRPLGEPEFHHHRFATKKQAEAHARQLSLVESGRYITVHHRGLEVSEWYKGTTPREPGWAGGYRPHGRTMGPERAEKHESGRNPLTLGERAKMRLGVLSPAAARSANSREKDLFRSHTGEIQRLAESVEACRRCEHGAEKKALKQLALARKSLEGLTKLAKYRSDPDVAEASLKAFRRQIAAAEGVLTGKKPAAIVKRDPKAGRGRHRKFGEYEEAQVHESENNPRVSRTHPRRREVAVFKAHSSSRATAVAAKLRKAGHDSAVIGGYGGRTVVIDTPTRGTKGGSLSAADAALRAKIRVLVGKK
jgi:hypothetical protein